jgi:hypothetical protein
MRGLFPNVVAISVSGTDEIPESEIRSIFEELIADRSEPAHETHTVDVRRPGEEG